MPKTLAPIPNGYAVTEKDGSITIGFRLRWEDLVKGFQQSPTVGTVQKLAQVAALASTPVYTTRTAGLYRLSYALRKTVADGVSSSLQVTWHWIESGLALTETDAALATDSVLAVKGGSRVVYADANTDLSISIAYASNTPGLMQYRADASAEQFA